MLEYEWGNPSSIMLTGDEPGQEPDPNRPVYDQYNPPTQQQQQQQQQQQFPENNSFVVNPDPQFAPVSANPHHNNLPFTHFTSFYDSRAYGSASSYPHHAQPASMLSLEPGGPAGYMVVPKSEPMAGGFDYNHSNRSASADQFHSRLGLNLGGRTYFASSEDDFVSRLYRRSRILEPGSVNSPKCQAEGCNADLSHAKHYHRRHKVCEFHSKAAAVIAAGLTQRFCQQCSRFHLLSEFDNGKRSCRKRLADHNRRRRKSQQSNNQESSSSSSKAHQLDSSSAPNSSSENLSKSPPDSRQHSSSVTVALSPPKMSLDCFGRRSYTGGGTSSSTASTSSLFYSNR